MDTLRALFGSALDRFGDRTAVRVGEATTSYQELVAAADRLAHVLLGLGVRPGDPVALMMSNRIEWLVADQAILRVGGAEVPVNPMLSPREIAFVLEDSGARVALADGPMATVARNAGLEAVLVPGPEWDLALAGAPAGPADVEVSGSDVGLILYTGGTTGRQKGVVHTQAGLVLNLLAHVVEIGLQDDECLLLTSPLAHSAGFLARAGLLKGATVLVAPRFDAADVMEAVARHAVTLLFLVPTMIYRLLDARVEADLSSLRTILYGAAPITADRLAEGLRRFGPVFMQLYGQSEAPNFLTRLTREDHDPARPERMQTCGRAATMVTLAILDDDGIPVPAGRPGEVCARAPYVMAGYHGLPEKTAETLRHGWLRTGDIGALDADGYLRLLDRRNDMVISGGMNVYTTEVEDVVGACDGVDQVAVVGVPHPDWGEAVIAFVVATDGFDATSVDDRCRTELAAYKRPKAYQRVPTLPTTPVGKIDKKALRTSWNERAEIS